MWKRLGEHKDSMPDGCTYILDGGSLLKCIPWKTGQAYDEICQTHVDYVSHKFGMSTTIEFNGYSLEPTTKDLTHNRHSQGIIGPTVNLLQV